MTSSGVPGTRPARPIRGMSGINCSMLSVPHGPAGDSGTVFRNTGTQGSQVFDRFRRPNDVHFADRLGAGRSRLPPQELTHALTCSWGRLFPRSSVPMAFRTPATCHSLTSRYSLSASAARNDRLRPVLFASFSSRFLTSVPTRTVKVVDGMADRSGDGLCTYYHKDLSTSTAAPHSRQQSRISLDELTNPLRLARRNLDAKDIRRIKLNAQA